MITSAVFEKVAERAVVDMINSAVIDSEAVDVLVGCVVAGGT